MWRCVYSIEVRLLSCVSFRRIACVICLVSQGRDHLSNNGGRRRGAQNVGPLTGRGRVKNAHLFSEGKASTLVCIKGPNRRGFIILFFMQTYLTGFHYTIIISLLDRDYLSFSNQDIDLWYIFSMTHPGIVVSRGSLERSTVMAGISLLTFSLEIKSLI